MKVYIDEGIVVNPKEMDDLRRLLWDVEVSCWSHGCWFLRCTNSIDMPYKITSRLAPWVLVSVSLCESLFDYCFRLLSKFPGFLGSYFSR
jgi:hypothetical protein